MTKKKNVLQIFSFNSLFYLIDKATKLLILICFFGEWQSIQDLELQSKLIGTIQQINSEVNALYFQDFSITLQQ